MPRGFSLEVVASLCLRAGPVSMRVFLPVPFLLQPFCQAALSQAQEKTASLGSKEGCLLRARLARGIVGFEPARWATAKASEGHAWPAARAPETSPPSPASLFMHPPRAFSPPAANQQHQRHAGLGPSRHGAPGVCPGLGDGHHEHLDELPVQLGAPAHRLRRSPSVLTGKGCLPPPFTWLEKRTVSLAIVESPLLLEAGKANKSRSSPGREATQSRSPCLQVESA